MYDLVFIKKNWRCLPTRIYSKDVYTVYYFQIHQALNLSTSDKKCAKHL